jgi:tetratricopeptide (TPR) repeat protein
VRLYRLIVQLPSRSRSLFQQPPRHEDVREFLSEGLDLTARLRVLDTLEGAALLAARAFFWWSWGERRGENELIEGLRSAAEAVRIAERLDDPHVASESLDALGNMQAITADLRGALDTQSRRLRWATRLDDPHEQVDIYAEVCMANAQVGQFVEAIEQGQRAIALADNADADALRASGLRSLTIAYFEWEHWPEAIDMGERLRALAPLEARSGRVILPQLLSELAEVAIRMRDDALYSRFGAQALELGWRSGSRKALAQAIRARGIAAVIAGRWDDAQTDLESAVNRYHEMDTRWEEGRTHEALAWLYQQRHGPDAASLAQAELACALKLFEAQHAVSDIERLRATMERDTINL